MSSTRIRIQGHVPVKMEIVGQKLFCNSSHGCIVLVNNREIVRVNNPVKNFPVDYILKKGESWTFIPLDK